MNLLQMVAAQHWHFWIVLALFLVESVFAIQNHVLMCNMPLADTLLLVCSLFFNSGHKQEKNKALGPGALFQRICGCVAFCAVLFVNTTHALEMLTEFKDEKKMEAAALIAANDTSALPDDHEHDVVEDHSHQGIVPDNFVIIAVVDICIKVVLLFSERLPEFGMPTVLQLFLHVLATVSGIVLFILQKMHAAEGTYFLDHLDPLVGIAVSVISISLIVPSFRELKPYIFADTPQCFDSDEFSAEISNQFDGVRCTHIHVYRIWPKSKFEAIIHINVEVDKALEEWALEATYRYNDIAKFIRSALTKGGAEKVVIEPRFIDSASEDPDWRGCVGTECFVEDRGCCSQVHSANGTARGGEC